MSHTLRAVDRDNEVWSAWKMLSGFDDDIARDARRTVNRVRSVLTQIYPGFERVLAGDVITRPLVLDWMNKQAKKDPTALVDVILDGLKAQTVTVPGTAAAEVVIP